MRVGGLPPLARRCVLCCVVSCKQQPKNVNKKKGVRVGNAGVTADSKIFNLQMLYRSRRVGIVFHHTLTRLRSRTAAWLRPWWRASLEEAPPRKRMRRNLPSSAQERYDTKQRARHDREYGDTNTTRCFFSQRLPLLERDEQARRVPLPTNTTNIASS